MKKSGYSDKQTVSIKPQSATPPKIGLALSSGGAKGLAHIGVIQVLEEYDIPIAAISGSSMGAYVGSLWAAGIHGKDLEKLAADMQDKAILRKLADPAFPFNQGLMKGFKAKNHFKQSIGDATFDELEKELLVISADLDSHERIVFRQGGVADAVHASCAMPGIIVPVNKNGRRCTDGGVVDPVPVSALRNFCNVDKVIAVSVLPGFEEIDFYGKSGQPMYKAKPPSKWYFRLLSNAISKINLAADGNSIDTLRRCIRISQIRMAHNSCKQADVSLHAHTSRNAQWHDYGQFRQYIDFGRKVAEENLPAIRALIEPIAEPTDSQATPHEIQAEQLVG